MITWKQFLIEKHNHKYDYSSIQFDLPNIISKNIIAWSNKNIPDKILACKGREDEIHLTILYGLHNPNDHKAKKIINEFPQFKIKLGRISVFKVNPEFDVIKIEVISDKVKELNKLISKKCSHTNKYEYAPHVTLAYVAKGKANKFINNNIFYGKTIEVKELVYSSTNGTKNKIKLAKAVSSS